MQASTICTSLAKSQNLVSNPKKNSDHSQHTSRSGKCTLDLENFLADSRKDLMKGEDLTLLEQTTQLMHTPSC